MIVTNREGYTVLNKRFELYSMDAIDFLKTIPEASVDLVVTDPPYESLEKYRAIGTTTRLKKSKSSSNQWFQIFSNERFEQFFLETYRILKKNSHCYVFCDIETMFFIKPLAESIGFKFWKPIIWDKIKIGMGYHYRSRYEVILFFEKGKRKLNNFSIPDVLSVPRVFNRYPTEKPIALSEILIEQSSCESDVIIDPFMGSGSVGCAALKQKRRFIGNDILGELTGIVKEKLEKFNY